MRCSAWVFALFLVASGCSGAAAPHSQAPAPASAADAAPQPGPPSQPDSGVAVVELFTSESCSSCPPAEANLARIVGARDPQHVVALSFHVDYWNNLGWTDPFSSPDYTARQRDYAKHGVGGVYTPELIVNGARAMIGSHVTASDAAIDDALSHQEGVHVELALASGSEVAGSYKVLDAPAGALLELALLERSVVSPVNSGENAGRTLHQVDVVRAFQTWKLDNGTTGLFSFALPDGLSKSDVHVAAVVQDPESLHILGGTATP